MLEASNLLISRAENELPAGLEKNLTLVLSGILAAVLVAAAANIATLELLEKEYSDAE
jgi:hypothetical protein